MDTRTPNSISTWGELQSELDEIRDTGFAVNFGEGESSICAVGMAIYDLIGYPLAAIAVAVPNTRLENIEQAREIAPMMVQAQASVRDALNETA